MIAYKGGALKNGRRQGVIPSFGKAIHYLHFGTYEEPASISPPPRGESRVSWAVTRNLLNDDSWLAIPQMEAIASQNLRAKKPGYHMGASLPPGETLDQAEWEEVADAMLEKLGLEEHQAVIALHEDRGHQHMHVIVNRVAYEGHVWKPSFDEKKLTQVMRAMERRFGLRRVPTLGHLTGDEEPEEPAPVEWNEKLAAARIQRVIGQALRQSRSWAELESILASYGLRLDTAQRGGGAVVVEDGKRIRMSEIDRVLSGPKLTKRFGESLRAYFDRVPERPALDAMDKRLMVDDARAEATRIIDDLELRHATWTERNVRVAANHRYDFENVVELVLEHKRVQRIAVDSNGDVRFATTAYLADEHLHFASANALEDRVSPSVREPLSLGAGWTDGQRDVYQRATASNLDLVVIAGGPESGKTNLAVSISRSYKLAGTNVIGITPTVQAADRVREAAEIDARSLDAWRFAWRDGSFAIEPGTVFVIDDAEQIEMRRMARLLARIERSQGKAIVIGDPDGLQPIGPGAPFRSLVEHHDAIRLPEERFSLESWEREAHASRDLATVVEAFDAHDRFEWSDDRDAAIDRTAAHLLDLGKDEKTAVALTSTRKDADAINRAVRAARRAHGELEVTVDVGRIDVGVGDQVRFLRSDRKGGMVEALEGAKGSVVVAGELGTVRGLEASEDESDRLIIARDRGGEIRVDTADYNHLAHAHALTVYQAAARRVDHSVVLLGRSADRHQTRVALSRHRETARLVSDRQTFPSDLDLHRVLNRDRGKDLVSDYGRLAFGDTDPEKALDLVRQLEQTRASWTRADFLKLTGRNRHLVDHIETLAEVIQLSPKTYTTRRYLEAELSMVDNAESLASEPASDISSARIEEIGREHDLSDEQRDAFAHVASTRLSLLTGRAGSGKTRLTRALVDHFNREGITVRGAALAGKAADGLARESGVEANTLVAWIAGWERSEGHLSARDVLVVDEASMVDVRTMAKVLEEVERADARLVLIGDPAQLQPIGAGKAFDALLERHPAVTLQEIHRQRHKWQVEASRAASVGRLDTALEAYASNGAVHLHQTKGHAAKRLVRTYLHEHRGQLDRAVILAHQRKDVRRLNELVHRARKITGELGHGVEIEGREFSVSDRIILTANDRDAQRVQVLEGQVGVRNGALGTIEAVSRDEIRVRLDDDRIVAFDPKVYQRFEHGYATTIHKAQGITVDHAYLFATRSLQKNAAYVAITRHREALDIFASKKEFPDEKTLTKLGRRSNPRERVVERGKEPEYRELLDNARTVTHEIRVEREPAIVDPEIRRIALDRAFRRLNAHDEIERREQAAKNQIQAIREDIHRRSITEPLRAVLQRFESIYDSSYQARNLFRDRVKRQDLEKALETLRRAPARYGRLQSKHPKESQQYADQLATWALEQHHAAINDPEAEASIQAHKERIQELDAHRDPLGTRGEVRFELGVLAQSLSAAEVARLPDDQRAVFDDLHQENRQLFEAVRKATKHLARRPVAQSPDRANGILAPVLRAATRHALYRVSPPALRALMRTSTATKNPAGLLIQLAPPQTRPLLYLASLARNLTRGQSHGR